jgi:aspartate aminotransferase
VCFKLREDNKLKYEPEQILISCGAKHSLFNAFLSLSNEGDEVILPSPFWVSYPEMIKAAGARPIILNTTKESKFKIRADVLLKTITPKTKILILNSPSNPTGSVYAKEELEEIAMILTEKNIFCISDEIYEKIIYDGKKHISIASLGDKIKEQAIVINGVSKAYSMTGWRIGYAAADQRIITLMSNLQSHSTSNPTSISQVAAVAALSGPQDEVKKMVEAFQKRRDYIVDRISNIKGLSCIKPEGAFYVLVDMSDIINKEFNGHRIKDTLFLTNLLLSEAKVAVVPGSAFGAYNYCRFSYATSMQNLEKALDRIEYFLST